MERGRKEVQDRRLILNQPTIFFEKNRISPTNPSPKHFFGPLSGCLFFFDFSFLALVGCCSAVPLQLGADSDRAPSPAPVPPSCLRSIPNICLFFSSPMQAPPPPPPEVPSRTRFGRSGRLFFLVWSPSHLLECLRLSVLRMPPLCPMFANGSLFFPCYPAPTVPNLGYRGRLHPSFSAIHALPVEGPTPL